MRRKRLRDHARVVEDPLEHLGSDPGDAVRIDMVGEEVADHPAGPRGRQASEQDALLTWNAPQVDPDIAASCLAPPRQRELVDIGPQIADPIEGRGYSQRNDRAAIARQTTSQPVRIARSMPSGATWVPFTMTCRMASPR